MVVNISEALASVAPSPAIPTQLTIENLSVFLENDDKVKVAGIDADGLLRGKVMAKEKFVSIAKAGFGFSSAIFGWDMHDLLYTTETTIATAEDGYADFVAIPDLLSFRRIPWEENIPFFLLHFIENGKPVEVCSRSLLRSLLKRLDDVGFTSAAGVELEFMNFQTPSEDGYHAAAAATSSPRNLAAFLSRNAPSALRNLTTGNFGYSLNRPTANKRYFYDIFNKSIQFKTGIEGWHTETGPGVYEAALKSCEAGEMADRVALFKYLAKSVGIDHDITPCFMAKPIYGVAGNSGHIHVSLSDKNGVNIFARDLVDEYAQWPDIRQLSDTGRQFLAGVLQALPDLMPMFAPTINSYKRLVESYWAPIDISWGLEDRLSSIRLIAPPVCKPGATRLEIRIPGADLQAHFALGAILGAGLRGINKKLQIEIPPSKELKAQGKRAELLPNTLTAAVRRFEAKTSIAREIFGDSFVEFYAASRQHELRLWREAVTDWEFRRYIETV